MPPIRLVKRNVLSSFLFLIRSLGFGFLLTRGLFATWRDVNEAGETDTWMLTSRTPLGMCHVVPYYTPVPQPKWSTLEVTLGENHNMVLRHWSEAITRGIVPANGTTIIHVDSHSDLLGPTDYLYYSKFRTPLDPLGRDMRLHLKLSAGLDIGNFIFPHLLTGAVESFVWIRSDFGNGVYNEPNFGVYFLLVAHELSVPVHKLPQLCTRLYQAELDDSGTWSRGQNIGKGLNDDYCQNPTNIVWVELSVVNIETALAVAKQRGRGISGNSGSSHVEAKIVRKEFEQAFVARSYARPTLLDFDLDYFATDDPCIGTLIESGLRREDAYVLATKLTEFQGIMDNVERLINNGSCVLKTNNGEPVEMSEEARRRSLWYIIFTALVSGDFTEELPIKHLITTIVPDDTASSINVVDPSLRFNGTSARHERVAALFERLMCAQPLALRILPWFEKFFTGTLTPGVAPGIVNSIHMCVGDDSNWMWRAPEEPHHFSSVAEVKEMANMFFKLLTHEHGIHPAMVSVTRSMLDGFLPREHTELTEWLVFSAVVEAEKLRRGRTGRRIVYRPDAGYVLSPRNTFLGEVSCDHPCPGCFAFPL